ncbi:MAG: type II toxin-antitoxin system prevent-host-death family antitoxin [Rhodospirillales bacterium]|nr:type II toxin-antitoxin system prevent-host-death family antitoxin [Alphaproteobacteria bacterium]MCY4430678.1 type II toxin-antitoxin system prevent-host-death family antitoxin [Rhodospirillales bacterium]
MIVNISEAKAQLSNLIDRVYHGEKVVIAKNNLPVADLVPHTPEGKRELGILKGQVDVPDEALFEEDADIERMFYGSDD